MLFILIHISIHILLYKCSYLIVRVFISDREIQNPTKNKKLKEKIIGIQN
jgi:hypothetical protein